MESKHDTWHSIPQYYWIWSYIAAWKEPQFPHPGTFYICKNSNFSEEMLIKHNHLLPKINRLDLCISYIGLNLVLGLTHSLAFKRYTQIH